jgi:hypothetical protein
MRESCRHERVMYGFTRSRVDWQIRQRERCASRPQVSRGNPGRAASAPVRRRRGCRTRSWPALASTRRLPGGPWCADALAENRRSSGRLPPWSKAHRSGTFAHDAATRRQRYPRHPNMRETQMRYRHERMIRAREERKRQRLGRQQEVEAGLRSSLTEEERRTWQVLSEAVGRAA